MKRRWIPLSLSCFLTLSLSLSFCCVRIQQEVCKPERECLPEIESCQNLDLGLPSLQNSEGEKMLLFKLPSRWHFVVAAQADKHNSYNNV